MNKKFEKITREPIILISYAWLSNQILNICYDPPDRLDYICFDVSTPTQPGPARGAICPEEELS